MPTRFTAASAGAITRDSAASSNASPATMVIWPIRPIGLRNLARSLLRHRTIICFPACASFSITARPTNPDPPITATVFIIMFSQIYFRQIHASQTTRRYANIPQRQIRSAVSAFQSHQFFYRRFCLKCSADPAYLTHQFPAKSPAVLI